MAHFFDSHTFRIDLGTPVINHQAIVSKIDGCNYSLICGSRSGRIVVHSPSDLAEEGNSKEAAASSEYLSQLSDKKIIKRNLNLNREICCLKSGSDFKTSNTDIILIASRTNLLAYDMYNNFDLFSKDIPDGIFCLTTGTLNNSPVVFVGGNCCIQGFDISGNEVLWTVTGGVVCSMCWCPSNNDGDDLLLVGTDDCVIRSFKREDIISEFVESGKIIALVHIPPSTTSAWFAYALDNGSIGVYDANGCRLWQTRHKINAACLAMFDVDKDEICEVIVGNVNGSVLVLNAMSGAVIARLPRSDGSTSVSALIACDYRISGQEELMVVYGNGSVVGYASNTIKPSSASSVAAVSSSSSSSSLGPRESLPPSEMLEKLLHEKFSLEQELIGLSSRSSQFNRRSYLIRALTMATAEAVVYPASDGDGVCVHVKLSSSVAAGRGSNSKRSSSSSSDSKNRKDDDDNDDDFNDTYLNIVTVILSDGNSGVISGQSCLIHDQSSSSSPRKASTPKNNTNALPSNQLIINYSPKRNLPIALTINILATCQGLGPSLPLFADESSSSSSPYFIHSIITSVQVCRYISMRRLTDPSTLLPAARCRTSFLLPISLTMAQLCDWINGNFYVGQGHRLSVIQNQFRVYFIKQQKNNSLVNLWLDATLSKESAAGGVKLMMTSEDVELMGDVVQCMCKDLALDCLSCVVELPGVDLEVTHIVERVKELNESRIHQHATSAETSLNIKSLVIAAEDCRVRRSMVDLRKAYTNLQTLNSTLIMDHKLRMDSHFELVEKLRRLNSIILSSSNLRYGTAKTEMVAQCREALRSMNVGQLVQLLRDGNLHK